MRLDAFTRLPAAARALTLDGLSGLIDTVAAEAVETHRFLRFQWYAAALAAYGGAARTIVVEREGDPVIALLMIATGPRWLGMASVPGSYRSEEHTSELQSLMRISYAVFCLKKKKE